MTVGGGGLNDITGGGPKWSSLGKFRPATMIINMYACILGPPSSLVSVLMSLLPPEALVEDRRMLLL